MKTRILSLLFFLSSLAFTGRAQAEDFVQWKPFMQGMAEAFEEKKYLFIDFSAEWCSYCVIMENTTFKDPKVVKELEQNFISIRVHPESKGNITWQGEEMTIEQFCAKLGVYSLPSMLFLNNDKEIIGSYMAYADGKMMYDLLTYISSGSRERNMTFKDFLNKRQQ